ncbi:hypothetical protein C7S16_4796 [Burkholderia thailandensis]|uniref:Uncharacterized protein n=1 Tax=Burkholderia thailandensis TaxID=57975 RepID=A0AAW9CM86_BURTH|nr:hypothetical protein [Burkholderia thailandensis]MDW9251729.1 hypothetical protein [Burkholderia thailandensis]
MPRSIATTAMPKRSAGTFASSGMYSGMSSATRPAPIQGASSVWIAFESWYSIESGRAAPRE